MPVLIKEAFRFFSKSCRKTKKPQAKKKPPKLHKSRQLAAVHPAHQGSHKVWRNIFLFLCCPIIALATFNVFGKEKECERPPFVKHEYLRIRTKKFPWGDGQRSLFHNPKVNALPDGYEEIEEDSDDDED